MKITIYTKKGEVHSYENVEKFDVHDVGPGLLTFLHDDRYIEYYRLGTLDRWTVEEETENESQTKRKEDVCRGRRLSDEESQAALTREQIEQQKVIRDMEKYYFDRENK